MPQSQNTLEGFKGQRVRRKYRSRGQRGRPRSGRRGRAKSQKGVPPRFKDFPQGVQGLSKLSNTPINPLLSRSQPPGTKTRGKVTFWTDLEATYFQRLEQEQIEEVFTSLRKDETEITFDLSPNLSKGRGQAGTQQNQKLFGEFFSFFEYYQEVINELQDYCQFTDPEEIEILRAAQVIDQHLILKEAEPEAPESNSQPLNLLGYSMTPCNENPNYSTDYFANQLLGQTPSRNIDDQLVWLEKELQVAERQVDGCKATLERKIRSQQKQELRQESFLNSTTNQKRLSEHFAQTVLLLELMQISESIERVKAVRKVPPHGEPLEVPFILQRAHSLYIERTSSNAYYDEHHNNSLSGKEFLLSFDKCIKLEDTWVDAPLFALLNKMREELAKRQNSGRGLPVQLGIGFTQILPKVVNFDLDQEYEFQVPHKKSKYGKNINSSSSLGMIPPSGSVESQHNNYMDETTDPWGVLDAQTYKKELPKYGNEYNKLDFCHHCKQLKRDIIFVKCNYQSSKHRMFYPAPVVVNGTKIYNAETHNKNMLDQIILKKLVKDKKRRKTFEDQLEVTCDKSFCSLCLKNFYDTDNVAETRLNQNWICPYCTGACFCTRCRRQEQLNTAKGYLVSLNLRELLYSPQNASKVLGQQFNKSNCPIDNKIKAGFEHTVRTCDLTQQKRQSLNSNLRLADLVAQNESASFFLESQISTTNHVHRIMARTKQKKVTSEETKSHAKSPPTKNCPNIGKLRKRLFHEYSDCVAKEYQTCSQMQHEAYSMIRKVDDVKNKEPSPKKSVEDGACTFLDPIEPESHTITMMANTSADLRLPQKSRTPMLAQLTIEPPLGKRRQGSLSKTANPSQVKNNTNSKLIQSSINSGAKYNHNPYPQQHSRHSTGSTSPSNTSKHFFNNPKGGGGQPKPLLPAKPRPGN